MKPEGSVGVAQPGKAADSRSVALVAREFESPPRRLTIKFESDHNQSPLIIDISSSM